MQQRGQLNPPCLHLCDQCKLSTHFYTSKYEFKKNLTSSSSACAWFFVIPAFLLCSWDTLALGSVSSVSMTPELRSCALLCMFSVTTTAFPHCP